MYEAGSKDLFIMYDAGSKVLFVCMKLVLKCSIVTVSSCIDIPVVIYVYPVMYQYVHLPL